LKNINGAALFAWPSSNQPAVVFSQNKPAPTIRHQPTEQVVQNKQKASDITTDLSHVAWLAFN
jgi:hypothetical protein